MPQKAVHLTSTIEWSTNTLRLTLLAWSPEGGRGITPPCIVLLLYGPLWLLSTYTPACARNSPVSSFSVHFPMLLACAPAVSALPPRTDNIFVH